MIVPVPIMKVEIPELPNKNWQAMEVIDKRRNAWYKKYPHGVFEVLPAPSKYYEYADTSKIISKKILFQIIRKSEDASFMEGNYEEELVFFIGEKDYGWFPPIQYFHFEKWYKPVCYEWAAGMEIPIEQMEEIFNIPFRENWKYRNVIRKQQFKEREEQERAMSRIMVGSL